MSTNKGISCLLRDKDVFYNYDHWDNVPMGNFMSGSVAKDQNGRFISVPSMDFAISIRILF